MNTRLTRMPASPIRYSAAASRGVHPQSRCHAGWRPQASARAARRMNAQGQNPEQGHQQIRRRAGGRHPGHVLARLAQCRVVHRHRLRPAEEELVARQEQDHQRHDDGADEVDVAHGVEADAPWACAVMSPKWRAT